MQLYKILTVLSLSGGLALASSLAVYQDSSIYTYTPQGTFIGFADNVKAKCKGRTVVLNQSITCPEEERLCKVLGTLNQTEQKLKAVQADMSVLHTLVSLPQPKVIDADNWIKAAERIGKEQAKLSSEETALKQTLLLQNRTFGRQAPSRKALYLEKACSDALVLVFSYGQVQFTTYYEARLYGEKEIKVTQYLSVTNRSGVDIEADEARFYYRRAQQSIRPVHFSPWIVSQYIPKHLYAKKASRNMMQSDAAVMAMSAAVSPVEALAPEAQYLAARQYRIKDLSLPSSGKAVDAEVTSWKVPLKCEIRAYPYRNSLVFDVCSFTPKTQIERNSWKIKKGDRTVNDAAVGEYDNGTYRLYTQTVPDIKVIRKPLVKRERTTGIFGSTIRKKDGFILVLTNKSDAPKNMIVTERIPTSETQKITVKLLEVKSDKKVDYTVSKEGKIKMKLSLDAHETKKIEVLFEISYDKALKITY
ncbi:Aspartate ammonia-lyase [hydrothermal vent metagenome]|uniref:Aspartate ammonia-lyase n=1 Tax=hydrothermal vent metagenome TaxID=652676 RepID=A0A1W1CSB1_9ZZZZ